MEGTFWNKGCRVLVSRKFILGNGKVKEETLERLKGEAFERDFEEDQECEEEYKRMAPFYDNISHLDINNLSVALKLKKLEIGPFHLEL